MIAQGDGDVLILPSNSQGYSEERKYTTELFVTEDGTEFRDSHMPDALDGPTRAVQFAFRSAKMQEARMLHNQMGYGISDSLKVPLVFSKSLLTSILSSSATVACVTTDKEYETVDQIVVMLADYSSYEVGTIDSVAANSITLTGSITGPFPVGSFVFPLILASPPKSAQTDWRFLKMVNTRIKMNEIEGQGVPTSGISPDTFKTYPIFDYTPRSSIGLQYTGEFGMQGEDWQVRAKHQTTEVERTLSTQLIQQSASDRMYLINFFDIQKGRLSPFWVRSHNPDYREVVGASSGASKITVEASGENLSLEGITRYVYIRDLDSYHKISNPNVISAGNELDVDPVLGGDLDMGGLIENFYFVRWASDALRINDSRGGALITSASVGFKELQPETPTS